ncbi:Dihydrolipoamide dehydrogenase of acetoin dehydrogenase [Streptococcus sp. DD11]|uniref:dihydrolipoyl dehydrogenase n=1 Tax=Streptococcus sp. DD11 TaxID=1777879 RepID=UPI000796A939|nr:dihydrolipoyl dehydrogenase [Streptococcus sp. DD11]KXT77370.1 Dihydrolipoamide dehydrogenase of acetoin dehydrogenase [Streptococcus sp. DD11]
MLVYDILIIGAGPGGYVAAEEAARLGKKVAVVEKQSIGGTCLNVGCIPSKSYLQHSHWLLSMQEASRYGIESRLEKIDFGRLVDRKNQVVASLQSGIHSTFKSLGIDYIEGEAQYVKDRVFSVAGREITAKDVILATGSHPFIPPIAGLEQVDFLTTDSFFDVQVLPEKLAIIGGGVIAIELAFAMAPLGVEVTVIEVAPEILLTEEAAARQVIQKKLRKMGVKIYQGARIKEVTAHAVVLEDRQIAFDRLLLAAGRKPNLQLAKSMGLALTERNFVQVDQYYETSKEHVYAVGDLLESYMLAHVASAEGIKAVRAICRQAEEPVDSLGVPRSLYTSPEIASFGLSQEEAEQAGYDVLVQQLPFSYNGRAIAAAETEGYVKLISEKQYHLLLGAVIVGPQGTDLLQELILLRQAEATLDQVTDAVFAHPTRSELLQDVAKRIVHHD